MKEFSHIVKFHAVLMWTVFDLEHHRILMVMIINIYSYRHEHFNHIEYLTEQQLHN